MEVPNIDAFKCTLTDREHFCEWERFVIFVFRATYDCTAACFRVRGRKIAKHLLGD
jgi:hypothetical protein